VVFQDVIPCILVGRYLHFMLGWPCIMNYVYNNQLDALFILSLLSYHTSTCFGRINSPSSGGRMYIMWQIVLVILLCWLSAGPLTVNPFQSNFSATRILPSSYLFWAGKRLVDYLSVLHEVKRRTGSDSGAGEQTQQKNVSDVFRHWSGTGKW
jgi:hypothetical protein